MDFPSVGHMVGVTQYVALRVAVECGHSELRLHKERIGAQAEVLFDIGPGLSPEFSILYRDGFHVIQGTPLILANVIFVSAGIDGHRFPQVNWQI